MAVPKGMKAASPVSKQSDHMRTCPPFNTLQHLSTLAFKGNCSMCELNKVMDLSGVSLQ